MKAVRIHEFGDLDVLRWEDIPVPEPSAHQVLVKVDSSGVNYADIMRRRGGYPGPNLPSTLGLEAAGVIEELGSDVTGPDGGAAGDGDGAAGERGICDGERQPGVSLPGDDGSGAGGGMPIVFLTAYHLLKTRGGMQAGDTVLIQAGASGVGTVATQLAKAWGARVITTASTADKLELCRSLGADVTINYTEDDFEDKIGELSDGKGVELVLECVGGPVLEKSVRCVASYGRLISYGNASGTPANIPSGDFTSANRTIIGFSMGRSPAGSLDHKGAMAELFPMISSGQAKLVVDRVLPMSEVGQAHEHLSNRGTRGKVILTP